MPDQTIYVVVGEITRDLKASSDPAATVSVDAQSGSGSADQTESEVNDNPKTGKGRKR
jgi:hypothetical protein